MKKVLFLIAVIVAFASCVKPTATEAPVTDSTTVVVDSVSLDSSAVLGDSIPG